MPFHTDNPPIITGRAPAPGAGIGRGGEFLRNNSGGGFGGGNQANADLFTNLFGNTPPGVLLRQQQQGAGEPNGGIGAPPGGPGLTVQPGGGPPPELAGTIQSAAPGVLNGNQDNGFQSPAGVLSAQLQGQIGGGAFAPPAAAPQPQAAPPPQPQQPIAPPSQAPPQQIQPFPERPAQQSAVAELQQQLQAPPAPIGEPAPFEILPQGPGKAPEGQAATATGEQAPPESTVGFDDLTTSGSFNETGIRLGEDAKNNVRNIPWSDVNWNQIKRNVSKDQKVGARTTFIENSGDAWTRGFWRNAFGKPISGTPLPPPSSTQFQGLVIDDVRQPDAAIQATTSSKGVQSLIGRLGAWTRAFDSIDDEIDSDRQRVKFEELTNKIAVAQAALRQYGIEVDAFGDTVIIGPVPDPNDGTNPTVPPVGGQPPVGDGSGTPPVNPGQVPLIGGEAFRLPSLNTTTEPKIVERIFGPRGQRTSTENAVAAEIAANANVFTANQQGQQLGVNEQVNARNAFVSDPFFQGIREQGASLANQSNFDFTGIKNQAVADQQQAFQQLLGQLGGSAASRNLPSSSVAGAVNEGRIDQSSALARLLGDLSLQEQQSERQFGLQNLGILQDTFGSTTGADVRLRNAIAQGLGSPVPQAFNPLEGTANAAAALRALDLAENADDGSSGLGGVLGSVGGGLIGSLVPGGSAAFGSLGAQLGGQLGGQF